MAKDQDQFRVAIYARLSRRGEDKVMSVPEQVKLLKEEAERRGWKVPPSVIFTDDGITGWKSGVKRPGFDAVIAAIAEHKVDGVLSRDPSRLSRNQRSATTFYYAAVAATPVLAFLHGSDIDVSSARGRRNLREEFSDAEYDSDKKSEWTKDGHQRLADLGQWSGGPRPYGFDIVGGKKRSDGGNDGKAGRLVPNPHESAVLRDVAKRLRLSESTITAIVRELNARGEKRAQGGHWSTTRLKRTLLAPVTAGKRGHYGDAVKTDQWEPIITEDEQEALRDIFEHREHGKPERGRPRSAHLLAGIIRCADHADLKMSADKLGYRCPGSLGGCNTRVAGSHVDEYVWSSVIDRFWSDDAPALPTAEPEDDEAVQAKRIEVQDAETAVQRSTTECAAAGMSPSETAAFTAGLKARLTNLREELKAMTPTYAGPAMPELFAGADRDDMVTPVIALDDDQVRARNLFLRTLIDGISVERVGRGKRFSPERVTITWRDVKQVAA
jgi:site-specific DNA recombinase